MRVSGTVLAFGIVAAIGVQISTAGQARAQSNPVGYSLVWGESINGGQMQAKCTSPSNQNCILNDSATYTAGYIRTSPLSARVTLTSSVVHSDRYGADVPWCTIQVWCHDGGTAQHVITDHQNGASCSAANAFYQNPPGTNCDVADQILIMVGINRGGWAWYW